MVARGHLEAVPLRGISPERARADHLAQQVEHIREALIPLLQEVDRLRGAIHEAWSILEQLPRQT